MNIFMHGLSAIPFLIANHPFIALGAILPDITWIYNEYRYRMSGYTNWRYWADSTLTKMQVMPYKLAHSALIVLPLCLAFKWYEFAIGWCIHIALDLPTHGGKMTQQPLYPLQWRWKWIMRRYR